VQSTADSTKRSYLTRQPISDAETNKGDEKRREGPRSVFISIFISVGRSGRHSTMLSDRLPVMIFERMASRGASGTFYDFIWRHGLYSSTDGQNFTRLTTQPTAGLGSRASGAGPTAPQPASASEGASFDQPLGDCVEDEAGGCLAACHVRIAIFCRYARRRSRRLSRRQSTSPLVPFPTPTDPASKGDPRLPFRRLLCRASQKEPMLSGQIPDRRRELRERRQKSE
jgi:hypothetical protein